jgi:hypothetical protein
MKPSWGPYAGPFFGGVHLQAPGTGADSLNWVLDALCPMVDTIAAVLDKLN